jgi:hypothetical protein
MKWSNPKDPQIRAVLDETEGLLVRNTSLPIKPRLRHCQVSRTRLGTRVRVKSPGATEDALENKLSWRR